MPMIGKKVTGGEVAFYLPDEWWMSRGHVCLHADAGQLCFVRRNEAGYTPVPVYEWPPRDRPPVRTRLSIADAEAIASQFNEHTLKITEADAKLVVHSSMRAQDKREREGQPC